MPRGDAAKKRWELAERAVVRAEKRMRLKAYEVEEAWKVYDASKKGGKKKVEALREIRDKTDSFHSLRNIWQRKKDISWSRLGVWQKIANPENSSKRRKDK